MQSVQNRIPIWAKAAFAILILAMGFVVGAWLHSSLNGTETIRSVASAPKPVPRPEPPPQSATKTDAPKLPPASAGTNHPQSRASHPADTGAAQASFAALEGSLGSGIGVAVVPLGAGQSPQTYGGLQVGHSWSTLKVPIVVTLMREGPLSPEEQSWARSAITASDNEAAAALFGQLENSHGGLGGASLAVQETLAAGGDPSTQVATAPPPPGAVSTWGQTEWSLSGAATFYRALACGALLDGSGTSYVLALMGEVIPEQQWGLGQVTLPAGTTVAYKAGWGPEAASGGGYLVRQTGIVRSGSAGIAVAMMVEDSSGSFEAGVQDIDQVADWVGQHLRDFGGGSC
jgi:hypothetical protein